MEVWPISWRRAGGGGRNEALGQVLEPELNLEAHGNFGRL
jgi:hypothetical protein